MVHRPEVEDVQGNEGKDHHRVRGEVPGEEGVFQAEQRNDEVRLHGAGPLEGTKSCSKVILRLTSMDFQYPMKDKPTIVDVNLTVSQVSRVAVMGANGARKSMAIRVLVGEQLPTSGSIWKAAGLRRAYVGQHAFHHFEKHMQETPTQYIMWRFAGCDDQESIEFSVDEESARSVKWCIDGVTGSTHQSLGR